MILAPHTADAGLFSQINFVITHIHHLQSAEFHVDWTGGTPYAQGEGINLFDCLFHQPHRPHQAGGRIVREWPHHKFTGDATDSLYLGASDWRWELHDCWRQLRVQERILQDAERVADTLGESPVALHVRNSKIGSECPNGAAPTLDDYLRVVAGGSSRVFLATDNDEAVRFFHHHLGDRLCYRPIARGPDMRTEFHLSCPQSLDDARNCLLDALVMARCCRLIHSVSNLSTAVLYINPRMDHVYLRCGEAIEIPAGERNQRRDTVKRVVASAVPDHVLRFEHPYWSDWILIFPEGVFVRHATGCAGTIETFADGLIALHWLDWDPEVFEPVADPDPRLRGAAACCRYRLT